MHQTEALRTTRESAEWLHVSEDTFRRWVKQGLVPRIAINQRVHRYRQQDLEALVSENESRPVCQPGATTTTEDSSADAVDATQI